MLVGISIYLSICFSVYSSIYTKKVKYKPIFFVKYNYNVTYLSKTAAGQFLSEVIFMLQVLLFYPLPLLRGHVLKT